LFVSRIWRTLVYMDGFSQVEALARLRVMCASGDAERVRKAARITVPEAARACGVHRMTIYRWEHGEFRATGPEAIAYLRLLDRLAAITADSEPVA
jgi:DNA-binding transcriptional regulator YiaG